jgi:hypothetical protein
MNGIECALGSKILQKLATSSARAEVLRKALWATLLCNGKQEVSDYPTSETL